MKKKQGYDKSNVDVIYDGGTIDRVKFIVDKNTGELLETLNAVYLPEKPKSAHIPKHKDFTKIFKVNQIGLIKSKLLSANEMGLLTVIENYITWESNILFDKEKESYMTGLDLHNITGFSRTAVLRYINRLAYVGILTLIRGYRNERRILLNPYLAYQGEKIDQWVLDLFDNRIYEPVLKIPFTLKTYIDNGGKESYYPSFKSTSLA